MARLRDDEHQSIHLPDVPADDIGDLAQNLDRKEISRSESLLVEAKVCAKKRLAYDEEAVTPPQVGRAGYDFLGICQRRIKSV